MLYLGYCDFISPVILQTKYIKDNKRYKEKKNTNHYIRVKKVDAWIRNTNHQVSWKIKSI